MTRPTAAMFTFGLALASACTKDDEDENDAAADDAAADDDGSSTADAGGDSSGDGASAGSTGADIDALWDCVDPMVAEFRPLVGPGYDAAMGGLLEPISESYIVATTKVIVDEPSQDAFLELSGEVTATLEASPGLVAYTLGREPTCGFWRTLSVVRTQEDMMAFVYSDAHSQAIARSGELTVTGKTDAWVLPAADFPPTWAMADERLLAIEPF